MKSKTKSFLKGCDYSKVVEYLAKEVETEDVRKKNTIDCILTHKYKITIVKLQENSVAPLDVI